MRLNSILLWMDFQLKLAHNKEVLGPDLPTDLSNILGFILYLLSNILEFILYLLSCSLVARENMD